MAVLVFVQWNHNPRPASHTNPSSTERRVATKNMSKRPLNVGAKCISDPSLLYWGWTQLPFPFCSLKKAMFVYISSMQIIAATLADAGPKQTVLPEPAWILTWVSSGEKTLTIPSYHSSYSLNRCSPFPPWWCLICCWLFPTAYRPGCWLVLSCCALVSH